VGRSWDSGYEEYRDYAARREAAKIRDAAGRNRARASEQKSVRKKKKP
jgi:hypothetical protein